MSFHPFTIVILQYSQSIFVGGLTFFLCLFSLPSWFGFGWEDKHIGNWQKLLIFLHRIFRISGCTYECIFSIYLERYSPFTIKNHKRLIILVNIDEWCRHSGFFMAIKQVFMELLLYELEWSVRQQVIQVMYVLDLQKKYLSHSFQTTKLTRQIFSGKVCMNTQILWRVFLCCALVNTLVRQHIYQKKKNCLKWIAVQVQNNNELITC